jgi:hypothetical protein
VCKKIHTPAKVMAMAVVIVSCAAAVDAATTIPSSALTAAAKTPLPLPPLIVASVLPRKRNENH